MKKLKFCLICLVSVLFVSCTNELIDVESSKSEVKTKAMSFETIILEDSILNFADNSALENALSDIENVSGLLKKEGFKSLYNVFDDAMAALRYGVESWRKDKKAKIYSREEYGI